MMNLEQFEELCSCYALGALDPSERTMFDEALAHGGEEFQRILRESIDVTYLINSSITRVSPSPGTKSRLMKNINSDRNNAFPGMKKFLRFLGLR